MMTTYLTWMLCLYIQSFVSSELYISRDSNTWYNALTSCRDNKQFGGEEMTFCQPENCMPDQLLQIEGLQMEREILWINGYVVKSPVLQHQDCFEIRHDIAENVTTKTTFNQNSALRCSIYCSVEKKGNPGNYIYLQNNTCYCVPKDTHDRWLNAGLIQIRETDTCNVKCKGEKLDRCGGNNTDVMQNTLDSVYVFLPLDNIIGKFIDSDEISVHCISVDEQGNLSFTNCKEELKVSCTRNIVSSEKGLRPHNTCTDIKYSWYDARRYCNVKKGFIGTQNSTFCGSESIWHGSFRTEEIIWKNISTDPAYGRKCLAVSVKRGAETRLLALDCDNNHKTLCINVTSENNDDSSTDIPTKENTEVPFTVIIFGVISTMLVPLFTIIAVVCVKKKICKTAKETDSKGKQHVAHSAVKENTGADVLLQINSHSQYNYIDVPSENCLTSDCDVYNHLRDDMVTIVAGNIYSHVGPTENEYDTSATSNTKPKNDDNDTLYDHTRTTQTSIYDTTDTSSDMASRN